MAAVDEAAVGAGSAVLVFGEAGIGKSSLVRALVEATDQAARLLVGTCDDLVTPRTFGPLRDAVTVADGALAGALIGEPDPERVYRGLLDELTHATRPTVLVVEDVQWADDATLDALGYLARGWITCGPWWS